jgi:hypothetical protein
VTKLLQLLLATGTAAALLGSAAPAFADQRSGPRPSGDTEEHCYVVIATGHQKCFRTFAEVTAAMSGGRVVLQSPSQLTDATAAQISQAAASVPRRAGEVEVPVPVTILGIVYADVGYRGSTHQFLGNSGDCNLGTSYSFDSMPSGWDNRVSSFEGLGHCRVTLFENENRQGNRYGPDTSASLGGLYMNDRTSSMLFA